MKISKIYLRVCSLLFACFLVCGSILRPVVTYASPYDLMIGSSSNALMTLDFVDDDYGISLASSVGTVTNTVAWDSDVDVYVRLISEADGSTSSVLLTPENVTANYSGLSVKYTAPDGYYIQGWFLWLKYRLTDYMPPSGTYIVSADLSSAFSYSYESLQMWSQRVTDNASNINSSHYFEFRESSGDFYIPGVVFDFTGSTNVSFDSVIHSSDVVKNLDFIFHLCFTPSTGSTPDFSTAGTNSSSSDYQDDVSSSLSDLSSSVDSMTEDLSSAKENLEYISTSQNLIIQGIDNVIMHISDQLYAFWNQLFNLIHLPTLAKMDDIISAINNMDLEIEVNLDGLKTTINNMSTAVQNKLQSTTDQITGGYDKSGMTSDKSELDGVLNQYEQAEEDLFEDAKGNINDFEFETPLEQFTGPLSDVSYFLSGLFDAMGPMNVIITFSLTLTIAMVMIGWYRFKGGR